MISNIGLRDERLSYKAKGLLAYMLTLPDDWIFYESELVNHSTDGKASVKSGLKELQTTGYLTRDRRRDEKGHLKEATWEISDEPMSDYPTLDNPTLEKPTLDNQQLLNTNSTKDLSLPSTDITKDIMSSKDDGSPTLDKDRKDNLSRELDDLPYSEIIDYLNEKTGKSFRSTTKNTKATIKARMREGFTVDDFKRVVDNKVEDWTGKTFADGKRADDFLRPETLFGTKFEGYLNEKPLEEPEHEFDHFF